MHQGPKVSAGTDDTAAEEGVKLVATTSHKRCGRWRAAERKPPLRPGCRPCKTLTAKHEAALTRMRGPQVTALETAPSSFLAPAGMNQGPKIPVRTDPAAAEKGVKFVAVFLIGVAGDGGSRDCRYGLAAARADAGRKALGNDTRDVGAGGGRQG